MSRTFQNILNMTWSHSYYTNGNDVARDFTVTPTASTANLLKHHKFFFRETEQGFSLYCDNVTLPQLPSILGNQTLHFCIKLKNPGFMNFTDLVSRSGSKDIYYLQCVQSGGTQAIQAVPRYPPVFTYTFTAPQAAPTLQLTDPEGTLRFSESFPTAGLNNELSASVDLTAYTSGRYTVSITGQSDVYLYISHEQPGDELFGIAAILLPNFSGFNANTYTALEYQFQFSTRAAVWQYHVSLSNTYTSLAMSDTLGSDTFTGPVPNTLTIGTTVVFSSANAIAYQESVKRGIRLTVDGNRHFDNQPNPEITNPQPRVYITL
ncbi:MAG: hypothetical protein AAF934_00175 [Bacteroidota bacterium]